jgi:hypothetical protein
MLVHLMANVVPLGLRIAGQEVLQLLVDFGDCLVMSLLEILEQLLGLLNLHLAGRDINSRRDSVLRPSGFQEILQHLGLSQKSLLELPTP